MVNYQNGMIYKLCCNNINITDIYIGSTVCFKERKRCHKKICNDPNYKNYNLKVYKFIRDNGGWNNWSMVLVVKIPCNSKLELSQHERKYYEELNATLNNNYPGRTKKEWGEKNKEYMKIKNKEWREKNKDILKIKAKEHYEKNKDIIINKVKKYYETNKEHLKIKHKERYEKNKDIIINNAKEYYKKNKEHIKIKKKEWAENNKEYMKIKNKEYRESNKEIIKIKQKEWREKNKEKIKIREKIKVNCPICNKLGRKLDIKRHQRTKKCIEASKID